jgi:hypothetical protein
MQGLKEPLVGGSSIYQIGGQPNHRAEEHVFVLKSIVVKYRKLGKPVIIQSSDISKYFDKEMIQDAILTCHQRGADPKAIRCWYNLNQDTRIRVRTGAGMSEFSDAGAFVGQGTLGGALVSQAVLDKGISEEFIPGGRDEMTYGDVPLAPLIFQDDVIHTAEGLKEARVANEKMDRVISKLNLCLNQDKTVCLVMGSRKQKQDVWSEIESQPLMCGNFETKMKNSFKWLGQILSTGGLSESVAETVAAREGKIRGACLEIGQIVNDWRAKTAGGMETALLLWEVCCLPSLLNGAGTWTEISKQTEKKLNQLQNWFLRLVLQIGPGAPLASLSWDTALLEVGQRVQIEKILLVIHIRNLEDNTLARKIYMEQKAMNLPGLAAETSDICKSLNIEDCNSTSIGKYEYKKLLLSACHKKNEERLRLLAVGKCERITREPYGRKDYLKKKNIFHVRIQYRSRFGMQDFAGNYSHDIRYQGTRGLCKCQESREDEPHLLSGQCKVYGDLVEKYPDLTSDESLVQLFTDVLERRDQLDREQ